METWWHGELFPLRELRRASFDLSSGSLRTLANVANLSKGIEVYFYSAIEGASVEFNVPGTCIRRDQLRRYSVDYLQVEKKQLRGALSRTGRFYFTARSPTGATLLHRWVDIDVITGGLKNGNMMDIEHMKTVTKDGIMVSYGFYDASHGKVFLIKPGLPKYHQCHVAISPVQDDWMGSVVPRGSELSSQRLSCLALPAAHDPGMSTMENVDAVLDSNSAKPFSYLLTKVNIHFDVDILLDKVLPKSYIRKVVHSLGCTQKDDIPTMLSLGVRYFEFRPGKLPQEYSGLADKDHFLHLVIPGLAYDKFLQQIVAFLGSHPDEIVIVQLRDDGIPNFIPKSKKEIIDELSRDAAARGRGVVNVGDDSDMRACTIRELRESNKRLLITKAMNVSQYSSYDRIANATVVPGPLIQKFVEMDREIQERDNPTYTILQCQATASSIISVIKHSLMTSGAANSVVMATKTICDAMTLPWIQENGAKFSSNHSLIIMNDFIEGATCDIAIELSKKRCRDLEEKK